MNMPRFRYFLASRPDPLLRSAIVSLRGAAGQAHSVVRAELLHLTWCVLAETLERDRFIPPRVEAALGDVRLASGRLTLGRVRGGRAGAAVYSRGHKPELLALYGDLVSRLAARGLQPLHRKSGFHPHFTIGHDPCAFAPFLIAREWTPDELLLIESEIGRGIHNVLGRWPLLPPRQAIFPFDPPPFPLRLTG